MSFSVLSDRAIERYRKNGSIIITPYNKENLNTSSYDVSLGEYFFREQNIKDEWQNDIYNIYSENEVRKIWGDPIKAKPYSYYKEKGINLENIKDNELIIFIKPQERILGHTNEFIGGTDSVTTMMKARSSAGRNFISVCNCAGWGDCGYFNRWTMEITNCSLKYKIPLVVGRRFAQIIFLDTEGVDTDRYSQNKDSKYQKSNDLDTIIKSWSPYDMLPKMYNDREIK